MPHLWQRYRGRTVSTLDLLGDGLTVLHGPAWRGAVTRHPIPVDVHRIHETTAFGIGPDGAVLVRPDGQIVARWPRWPADAGTELRDAVRAFLAPAVQPVA